MTWAFLLLTRRPCLINDEYHLAISVKFSFRSLFHNLRELFLLLSLSQSLQGALPHRRPVHSNCLLFTAFKHPAGPLMLRFDISYIPTMWMCLHSAATTRLLEGMKKKKKKNSEKEIQHQKGSWTMTELEEQWIKDQENSWSSCLLQSWAVDTWMGRSRSRARASGGNVNVHADHVAHSVDC